MAGNGSLSPTIPPPSPPVAAVAAVARCRTRRGCLWKSALPAATKSPRPCGGSPCGRCSRSGGNNIPCVRGVLSGSASDTAKADTGGGVGAPFVSSSRSLSTQCTGQRPGAASADGELMSLGQVLPRIPPAPSISGAPLLPRRLLRGSPFQIVTAADVAPKSVKEFIALHTRALLQMPPLRLIGRVLGDLCPCTVTEPLSGFAASGI